MTKHTIELSAAQIRAWHEGGKPLHDLDKALDNAQEACEQGAENQYIIIRVKK